MNQCSAARHPISATGSPHQLAGARSNARNPHPRPTQCSPASGLGTRLPRARPTLIRPAMASAGSRGPGGGAHAIGPLPWVGFGDGRQIVWVACRCVASAVRVSVGVIADGVHRVWVRATVAGPHRSEVARARTPRLLRWSRSRAPAPSPVPQAPPNGLRPDPRHAAPAIHPERNRLERCGACRPEHSDAPQRRGDPAGRASKAPPRRLRHCDSLLPGPQEGASGHHGPATTPTVGRPDATCDQR
jgi:hypothetical protein